MSSIFTLTALSASRWLLVTRAGRFPLNSRVVTAVTLVAVWAAAAAVAVPPLAGWSYYAPESSGLRYRASRYEWQRLTVLALYFLCHAQERLNWHS